MRAGVLAMTRGTRIAVCDLGTFSGLILIAERRGRRLLALLEERYTVDLSNDGGRIISPEGLLRVVRLLRRFDHLARKFECESSLVVCTAAIRDAENRKETMAVLKKATAFRIQTLSVREEAQYASQGALIGLKSIPPNPLVIDIGGGSTEILNPRTGVLRGLPLGAARATQSWKPGAPRLLQAKDLYYLTCAERAVLRVESKGIKSSRNVVGTGGTITTLAAIEKGLIRFDANRLHGSVLTTDWISATGARLARMSVTERRRLIPFDQSRASVLLAGTYLWSAVLNRLKIDRVTVSVRGLRWGVAAHLAGFSKKPTLN